MVREEDREEFRNCMNGMIERAKENADEVALLEMAREFFTNPKFNEYLKEYVWKINSQKVV